MQHPDHAFAKIALAAIEIQKLATVIPIQANGQRVDREITAVQVLLDRGTFYLRQRSGIRIELGACRHKVQRLVSVQDPFSCAKAGVRTDPSPDIAGQRFGQRYRISLDDEIDIQVGPPQEQVAHEPADNVQRITERLCGVGCLPQQRQLFLLDHLAQLVSDLFVARARVRPAGDLEQQVNEVRPGHNAQNRALGRYHRHLPHAVLHHNLLQRLDRIIRAHCDLALGHIHRDPRVFQAETHRAVDLAPR